MNRYRTAWGATVCTVLVVGFACAAFLLPAGTLVFTGLATAVVLPVLGAGLYNARAPEHAPALPAKSTLAEAGAAAGIAVIALIGLIDTAGGGALLVPVVLGLTCPAAIARLRSRLDREVRRPDEQLRAALPAPGSMRTPRIASSAVSEAEDYRSISDAELCWQWRTSFTALRHALTGSDKARLIQTRRALLDELARRDPAGFARWLDSGARAASDPARYLNQSHRQRTPGRGEGA